MIRYVFSACIALARDVRHACRAIVRMPVVAAVVVVSLGTGIGVNTVVFSWIHARVIEPLPGVEDGRSLRLVEPRSEAGHYPGASWLEYRDLRERMRSARDLLAFRTVPLYIGETGTIERAFGLLVSDNYFSALGVRPAAGRFPTAAEAVPGGEAVAVISHGLWRARFGGSDDALGRTIRVNGQHLTIIGVTPDRFQGTVMGIDIDMWVPAPLAPSLVRGSRELEDRRVRGYALMAAPRPGVPASEAERDVQSIMRQLAGEQPDTNATMSAEVLPVWKSPRGPQRMLTTALAVLQAVMLLLLLAVCGNAANLVLARASTRRQEMGVRLALGAGRARVASLVMVETLLLALVAAGVGIVIATWGTTAWQLLPLSGLPLRFQTSVNGDVLAFAVLSGIACGLLIGAAPAARLSRMDALAAVRGHERTAVRGNVRFTFMGAQVALASLVLIVAALFIQSFLDARLADPGFRREGVLLGAYDLTGRTEGDGFARDFPRRLLDRLRVLPGIEAVAVSAAVPLDIHGLPVRTFTLEGRQRTDGGRDEALSNVVSPGYFGLMGIRLRAGTDFAPLEDEAAPAQAVVTEAFVRRYLPPQGASSGPLDGANAGGIDGIDWVAALGRRIQVRGTAYTICGVVADSMHNAFGEPPTPAVYFSYRDNAPPRGEVHLRTRPGAEASVAPELRRIARDTDADVPVFNVRTLAEHVETNLVFRRIPARMFAVLGPMLLALAAIGIYAVVAYTTSQRLTEIGVRLALGATTRRVVAEVAGGSLQVVALGALAGWLVAAVGAGDPGAGWKADVSVFLGVPALLLAVAAVACWLPARRAAAADPMLLLRRE